MAQLVIAAAGAAIGAATLGTGAVFLGLTGGQIGWMLGSLAGSAFGGGQHSEGPKLTDLKVAGTEYGQPISFVQGAPRLGGAIWWASDKNETANTTEQGKGGGASYTSYTYDIDLLIGLSDNPGCSVTRVWLNGKLVYTTLADSDDASRIASEDTEIWQRFTVYGGADDQLPDPDYEAAVTNAPAYRGRTTCFIKGLALGSSGALPNLTFEVSSNTEGSPDIVIRVSVLDLGVGNRYKYGGVSGSASFTPGLGIPVIRRGLPSLAVETMPYNAPDIRGVSVAGEPEAWPSGFSAAALGPWTGSISNIYQRLDRSHPVGTIDGTSVRVQHFYTQDTGGLNTILALGSTSSTPDDSALDLCDAIQAGKRMLSCAMCSDDQHAIIFTVDTYVGPSTNATHWWIVRRVGGVSSLVRSGTIDSPIHPINGSLAYGNVTVAADYCAMLEDDLKHYWFGGAYSFPFMYMYTIGGDDVLRYSSGAAPTIPGSGADPQYYFSRGASSSCWAEAGFCYLVAGAGFFSFRRSGDVIGTENLDNVVANLCNRAGMPAGTYDVTGLAASEKPVRALAVGQIGSTRSTLDQLRSTHFFDAALSDKLYFRLRGEAAVATIEWDDLATDVDQAGDEPFPVTVASDLEVPSQVAVQYPNVNADSQTGTEHSDRYLAGQASLQVVQVGIGMTPSEAKGVAESVLRQNFSGRITAPISLPLDYSHVEPTDAILVPETRGGELRRMAVTKREDSDGVIRLELVADDIAGLASTGTTSEAYRPAAVEVVPLADTSFYALDIPLMRDADDSPGWYVAAKGAAQNWPSATIYQAATTSYTAAATVLEKAIFGTTTTALGDWAGGWVMDELNSVTVTLGDGQLSSVSRDALLADITVNAILIGSEIIRFCVATLQSASPNVYKLTRLLRGERGTEWAYAGHAIGERAVLLRPQGIRRVAQSSTDIGLAYNLKAVTAGKSLADVSPTSFTNTGISQKPLAPVNLRVNTAVGGGKSVSWDRRTRYDNAFCGPRGPVVPIGELSESYQVEIFDGADSIRRINVSSPAIGPSDMTSSAIARTYSEGVLFPYFDGTYLYGIQAEGAGARRLIKQSTVPGSPPVSSSFALAAGGAIKNVLYAGGFAYVAGSLYTDSEPPFVASSNIWKIDLTDLSASVASFTPAGLVDLDDIVWDGSNIWSTGSIAGVLRQHNSDLTVAATYTVGAGASGVRYSAGSFYIAAGDVIEYIPGTGEIWRTAAGTTKVFLSGSYLYIGNISGAKVLDKATGAVVATYSDGQPLSIGNGHPLFAEFGGNVIYRPFIAESSLGPFVLLDAATGLFVGNLYLGGATIVLGTINSNLFGIGSPTDNFNFYESYEYTVGSTDLTGLTVVVKQIGAVDGYTAQITI